MRVGAAGAGLKPWPGGYRWPTHVLVGAAQRPWPSVGRPWLAMAWLPLLMRATHVWLAAVPRAGPSLDCGYHRSVDVASSPPFYSPTASYPWRMPLPPCLVVGPGNSGDGMPCCLALPPLADAGETRSGFVAPFKHVAPSPMNRHLCARVRATAIEWSRPS